MKPRIFINMHYMELGGAERALLGMLDAIDTSRVDVDLFINQHTGPFMKYIPEKINLLPQLKRYSAIERPIKDIVLEGQFAIAAARLKAKWQHAKYYNRLSPDNKLNDVSAIQYAADAVEQHLPSLYELGEYDLAISFMLPHNYVLSKIKAKKKIAWIHTDYSTIHVNKNRDLPIWNKFDHIISISPSCTEAFVSEFPSLATKIIEIENILPVSLIRQQANEYIPVEYTDVRDTKICSVGRISYPKNFESIPYIASIMRNNGLRFHWFIIGPGNKDAILKAIDATNTSDIVSVLGARENPYPYIRYCDIYCQPSRFEGKSVTVREAQILSRPVVITNYPTAKSQITNRMDGIICDLDNDSIAKALSDMARNSHQRSDLSAYCQKHDFSGIQEVNKIYRLL